MHGKGIFRSSQEKYTYKGNFKEDKFEVFGVKSYDSGTKVEGTFKYGQFQY